MAFREDLRTVVEDECRLHPFLHDAHAARAVVGARSAVSLWYREAVHWGTEGGDGVDSPKWWTPEGRPGTDDDPDAGWWPHAAANAPGDGDHTAPELPWRYSARVIRLDDAIILEPLEAQFGQVRSRDRVRNLAEVFTHQREVDAMLDLVPDAFTALDVKFLEPACGAGNFLTEVLRRKLRLAAKADCASQEQYEHRVLRAAASIYGVDISPGNITEARGRMAHVLLEHYQVDANTVEPTTGFLNAAALILGANIHVGDSLNAADAIEMCDWRPHAGGRFQRVWSFALVPAPERDLFWAERVQDTDPVHYSELVPEQSASPRRGKAKAAR